MFTKKKFLSFSEKKRHKKLAELLRAFILHNDCRLKEIYNEILLWLKEPPLTDENPKKIFNRYHYHLAKADISLKEHNLLPVISAKDRSHPLRPSLNISIYLDNLRSCHNVGSIIRTVEAFRLGKIFFSPASPFIDNEKVKKASMGTYRHVECLKVADPRELPKPLICLETAPEAPSLYNFSFPSDFTLVVGNEEYGCSDSSLVMADFLLNIPMRGRKNSLNVANAFAIAAAKIAKQKDNGYGQK